MTLLSWLFDRKPEGDRPEPSVREDLRTLRARRRRIVNKLCSLRAYGFDTLAQDDEAALRALEKKILALQAKNGVPDEAP